VSVMGRVGKRVSELDLNQLLEEVYEAVERLAKLSVEIEGLC